MPKFVIFKEDPRQGAIDAPDMLQAAQIAGAQWAEQADQVGTATMPMWGLDVASLGYGECVIEVETTRRVTVTPKPMP